MFSDTHTHLDQFSDDEVEVLVSRAREVGVEAIVSVGSTLESSRRAIELSQRFDVVYAGVGLHPMDLSGPFSDGDEAALREMASTAAKVVFISETGLDFMETSPDRGWQEQSLRRHIRLAHEVGKPVDFHARGADDVILRVMREEKAHETGAIWHYFQGDNAKAEEATEMGFYLSLAKPLLRLPELQDVVRDLPIDRIVLETDSYPQPWKKNPVRRTEPSHVVQVAEKVAELKGLALEEVAHTTTRNFRRVAGIP